MGNSGLYGVPQGITMPSESQEEEDRRKGKKKQKSKTAVDVLRDQRSNYIPSFSDRSNQGFSSGVTQALQNDPSSLMNLGSSPIKQLPYYMGQEGIPGANYNPQIQSILQQKGNPNFISKILNMLRGSK